MLRAIIGKVVLVAVACVLGGLVLWTSSSFQGCVQRQQDAYSQEAKEKSPPLVFAHRAVISSRCAFHILYEYREAATAVATVFIALFTLTLWLSTRGMLLTARQQSIDMKAAITVAVEANNLARIAFNAERRPWLQLIDTKPVADVRITREGANVLLDLTIQNFGNWPAENVSVYLKVFRIKDIEAALSFCDEARIPASRIEFSHRTIFPREMPDAQRILVCIADKWPKKEAINTVIIAGVIGYRFSMTGTLHFTPFTYFMRRKGRDVLAACEDEILIPLDEIMLDKTQIGRGPT
jgi:hypothetical protein